MSTHADPSSSNPEHPDHGKVVGNPTSGQRTYLAQLLATGMNALDAVCKCGADPIDAALWLKDPDFQNEIRTFLPADDAIRDRFRSLVPLASDTLLEVMKDKEATAKDRISAARAAINAWSDTQAKKHVHFNFSKQQSLVLHSTLDELGV